MLQKKAPHIGFAVAKGIFTCHILFLVFQLIINHHCYTAVLQQMCNEGILLVQGQNKNKTMRYAVNGMNLIIGNSSNLL